jgi:hypothetical protein
MTDHEETRALEVFTRELTSTRDLRRALRAALIDLEARKFPAQRQRSGSQATPRPLLQGYRVAIDAVCSTLHANVSIVCSYDRADGEEADARGVIVGLLGDLGFSTRQISEGVGISNSAANNLRAQRPSRQDWESLIASHAHFVNRSRVPK